MSPHDMVFLSLPTALLALVCSYAPSVNAASKSSRVISSEASTKLICHTTNPADCYPAIFAPTKNFQIVHNDQSIPPGLHVRMNLASGLKEARLNVPKDNDGDESAIVVIDDTAAPEEIVGDLNDHSSQVALQDPNKQYNSFWEEKLVESPLSSALGDADASTFESLTSALVHFESSVAVASHLNALTEMVHDFELGLVLAEDYTLTARIFEISGSDSTVVDIDAKAAAALTLATALQNNDKAQSSLISNYHQHGLEPMELVLNSLRAVEETRAAGPLSSREVTYARRLVFLLSQLCQDSSQLETFTHREGFQMLSSFLGHETDGFIIVEGQTKLQARIANFVADHAPAAMDNDAENHGLQFCQILAAIRTKMSTMHASQDSISEAITVLDTLNDERCKNVGDML